MLTDLSFLDIGKQWPPPSESERLDRYNANRQLFEGEHAEVYREQFKRIERVINNFSQVISYPVIVNYQRLISLKVADLLLGESPKITAGDYGSATQVAVDAIIEKSDLYNTLYEGAIDCSRYGDGLLHVYKDELGGEIDVTQPPIWFPVVSPDNIKRMLYHVLAWTYEVEMPDGKQQYLKVQIHEKGRYTTRTYSLDRGTIIGVTEADAVFATGLSDFAIIPVPSVITSDRATGIDDYDSVDSIISEIMVRVGQISKILDKHASPSVQGPTSALEKEPATGEWKLKMGNYFPRDNREDPEVSYITWDGQLESNFKAIETLINQLHVISEMGPALVGQIEKTGQAVTGTALRLRMISPLAKVARLRMRMDAAVKKAIRLCSELGGKGVVRLTDTPISIQWQDGLPNDPKEEAEIMNIRLAGKATMSRKRALEHYDKMSPEDADNEIAEIEAEEQASNPLSTFDPDPEPNPQ